MLFRSSVIAASYLLSNHKYKYLIATLLYTLSVFSYQASLAIGGAVFVLFYLYDHQDDKIFTNIKLLFLNFIPYIIALALNFGFTKLPLFAGDLRTGNFDLFINFIYIIKNTFNSFVRSFGFFPIIYNVKIFC